MGKYVDGFVLVVPSDKTDSYKQLATVGRDMWMKHGALAYYECRGDDLASFGNEGEQSRRFDEMADAKDGEEVWFSFIVFESKEHRDEVNAKVMQDMGSQMQHEPMPFEMKRMAHGGFAVEVEGNRAA